MAEITYGDLYKEFCEWSPEHASRIVDYRPWGTHSIVVWFDNGMTYKIKRHAEGKFTMQTVSAEDVNKKLCGL